MRTDQVEIVSVEQLVPEKHTYRRLKKLLDFKRIVKAAKVPVSEIGAIGFGRTRLILCLILQFMEDLSDREFESFISENISGKWFCEFGLVEKTPDFTTICKFLNLVGTKQMSRLFNEVKRQLQAQGHCAEVFTFIDATALVSKLSLWEQRDKAIKKGYEKLNNEVLPKVSADPEAKIGAKSSKKFWYGFKKHVAVDMGMLKKHQINGKKEGYPVNGRKKPPQKPGIAIKKVIFSYMRGRISLKKGALSPCHAGISTSSRRKLYASAYRNYAP